MAHIEKDITVLAYFDDSSIGHKLVLCTTSSFNTILLQLGNNPSFKFCSDELEFDGFMTLFRSTFESQINDQEILFSLLSKNLDRKALQAIQPFLYSGKNRYTEAIKLLSTRFGNKIAVLNAQKTKLLSGNDVKEIV